jgi:hypothetical protein
LRSKDPNPAGTHHFAVRPANSGTQQRLNAPQRFESQRKDAKTQTTPIGRLFQAVANSTFATATILSRTRSTPSFHSIIRLTRRPGWSAPGDGGTAAIPSTWND